MFDNKDNFLSVTSLLPRLVHFKLSERKLNKVNSELRRLCNRRSLLFCNLIVHFYTITNQTRLTHPKIDSTKNFPSSFIGWELPETRKETLRSKLYTNTYNIK
jgi:hypothetical protein